MGFIEDQWRTGGNAPWRDFLAAEVPEGSFAPIEADLAGEYAHYKIFPPLPRVFRAFACCAPGDLRVVILGQDPYIQEGQADGLAFSFLGPGKFPPSLRNIVKELEIEQLLTAAERARLPQRSGTPLALDPWARQGVFLLNCSLTVREGASGSHMKEWQSFTNTVIEALAARAPNPLVFLLWGNFAKSYSATITEKGNGRHTILSAGHPSPLSARLFFGNGGFRQASERLAQENRPPVAWERILKQQEKTHAI